MIKSTLLFLFAFFAINSFSQKPTEVISVANSINYNDFFTHLAYLADDSLKGRDTGSEGYIIASDYVANEFNKVGLKPFGENGTYFQKVAMFKKSIVQSSVKFYTGNNTNKVSGVYGEDISLLINPKYDLLDAKQNLVFVGYGNIFEDLKINDYEGVDVKGKTVIVVFGAPKSVKDKRAIDPFLKVQTAAKEGASGLIMFYPKKILQNFIFKQMHGILKQSTVSLADTSLNEPFFDFDFEVGAYVKKDFVKRIFKMNGLNLNKELKRIAKGINASKDLNTTLNCSYKIKVENNDCRNVLALLPGNDPVLKDEFIVVGGHLDHLGVGKVVKGDSIYNGMWDNASGCAGIIMIAKAYGQLSEKPKRSIIFICYTGEEKGLLGSNYYANNTGIDNGKIVANLNIDMMGSLYETSDVIPIGYSHSNLANAIDFTAKNLKLTINDNKEVEEKFIERSDQMSFIKKGVPVIFTKSGLKAIDPKINAEKKLKKWMERYYHTPFDDLNQEYSPKAFLTALKVNFLTAYYISNIMDEIKWNEGSSLYKKYVLKETE